VAKRLFIVGYVLLMRVVVKRFTCFIEKHGLFRSFFALRTNARHKPFFIAGKSLKIKKQVSLRAANTWCNGVGGEMLKRVRVAR